MIIELVSNRSTTLESFPDLLELEPRISTRAAKYAIETDHEKILFVRRATSSLNMVEKFYVSGMKTTKVLNIEDEKIKTMCFLWQGSEVEVCFVERPATTQASGQVYTDFNVSMFENLLNNAHGVALANPNCGKDKWSDNHYAIDGRYTADWIVSYIQANLETTHYKCDGSSLHMIVDPTGWSIQLDLDFTQTPPGCVESEWEDNLEPAIATLCLCPPDKAFGLRSRYGSSFKISVGATGNYFEPTG